MKRIAAILLVILSATVRGEEKPIVTPTEFPRKRNPVSLSGELTMVDHVNRMGILRPDRNDKHNKYHWDLPHHFSLLPYGVVYRCGSPATLRDVPIGTHLHGQFYLGAQGKYEVPLRETEYAQRVANDPNEFSPDSAFSEALRLEDDFSFYQGQRAVWEIVSIDLDENKLLTKRIDTGNQSAGLTGEQSFDISEATQVWKGKGYGALSDLAKAQRILFNLEWATLYGPGRMTEIWIDEESRRLASQRQHRLFRQQLRDRGFPARVDHVEHQEGAKGIVTVSFYSGPTSEDFEFFQANTSGRLAVVESNLRTYHDLGLGIGFQEIKQIENPPQGHSGVVAVFRVGELLEGIRPGRSVRLLPSGWRAEMLPREERLEPFDIRPQVLKVDPEAR